MKTPSTPATPQRARFARKPWSLDDVLHNSDPSAPFEPIEIELHKELTAAEYDAFANELLENRDWLAGHGGHAGGRRYVVEVSAPGRRTLFVDPSGSAYGRYVGIAEQTAFMATPSTTQGNATMTTHTVAERMRPQPETFPDCFTYLPENECGIAEGHYRLEGFVHLLRQHKHEPEAIQFLADMLEE